MKRILLLGLMIFIFSLCSPNRTFFIDNQAFKLEILPGTVQVEDNFFIDKWELSNHSYREYLYWTRRVFGLEKYKEELPDTLVWRDWTEGLTLDEPYIYEYFRHPLYSDCPVVGLSYEQVMNYSKWRSDRVFEIILIEKGLLNARNTNEVDSTNYFSIERYFNGKIEGIKPDFSIPYPHYRLPTKAEWEKIAQGFNKDEFGIDYENRKIKRAIKKGNDLFRCTYFDVETQKEIQYDIPDFVWNYLPNDYKIYSMIGNVSEMIAEKGISKGGSFTHKKEECKISNDIPYEKPERWLGFRNVCTYQLWKK